MSSSDDGKEPGVKAEVFTFLPGKQQSSGVIAMALDYKSRGSDPTGETCGSGQYAQIEIQVIILDRSGALSRQAGIVASALCGKILSSEARYQTGVVPDIRIHNAR